MLTILEKVLLLQTVDLFGRLTSEQLSYVAAIAAELSCPRGQIIYTEGELADGLFIIISGSVLMRRNGEEIGRQSQGDAFGVWALLDDEPRLTTAEAREETRLLFVSRDDFYEMLSGHLEVVEGIMKHLAQRLRRIASVIEK
jgi:CRP/FNR family cyclic AMP-dependent transcriptional regulator